MYNGIFQKIRIKYFSKIIDDFIAKNDYVLDYGCGPGDFLSVCREKKINSIGIDSEINNVDIAKGRGFNAVLGDYLNTPFKEELFNVIVMQSVLEHIPKPVEALKGIVQYLSDDGKIIVSVPTPGPFFWDDPTHIRPYTLKSLKTLGELTGLKLIRMGYVAAYLLNMYISHPFFFQIINQFPFSLGTNLICVYEKKRNCKN